MGKYRFIAYTPIWWERKYLNMMGLYGIGSITSHSLPLFIFQYKQWTLIPPSLSSHQSKHTYENYNYKLLKITLTYETSYSRYEIKHAINVSRHIPILGFLWIFLYSIRYTILNLWIAIQLYKFKEKTYPSQVHILQVILD